MPLLWAELESDRFAQGSANWIYVLMCMYTTASPLARLLNQYGREGVMDRFFLLRDFYTDRAGRDALIAREWPRCDDSDEDSVDGR